MALGIYLLPSAEGYLEYHRAAISRGECWRLVSCHLTHFSAGHPVWDLIVFVGLGSICELHDRRRFFCVLGASSLLISGAIWVGMPRLAAYRGLSGIDSALFGLLALDLTCRGIRTQNRGLIVVAATFFVLFVAKTVFELVTGSTLFVPDLGADVVAVPLAHLAGFAVGVLMGLVVPVKTSQA